MPFLRKWSGFFLAIRFFFFLLFELGMCLASFRAAWILLSDQQYFDRNEHAFAWMSGLIAAEWKWGALAAVACALKLGALIIGWVSKSESVMEWAFVVRGMGWVLSAVLWTSMGISFMNNNDWIISSGNTLLLGIFSIGMVLAGPVISDRANGR